jgi:hypothetical protein
MPFSGRSSVNTRNNFLKSNTIFKRNIFLSLFAIFHFELLNYGPVLQFHVIPITPKERRRGNQVVGHSHGRRALGGPERKRRVLART